MEGQHMYHGTGYIPCEGIDRKKRFSVKKKTAGKDDTEFKDGKNAGAPVMISIDEKYTILHSGDFRLFLVHSIL